MVSIRSVPAMVSYAALVGVLLCSTALAFDGEFSYSSQDQWPAICVTGNTMRQSPLDIITKDVEIDEGLIDLEMTGWEEEYDGAFLNVGRNVRFMPDNPGEATTRNHIGTYDLLQFHFHWGRETGEGSEHLVDSDPGELEIHFVHRKQNEDNATVGDYLSVISVIAEVDDDAELSGPWLQLDVSQILTVNHSINITGFRFDQLLPRNCDYFYYEGSFTSPPCYEIVQWFVMKNRIAIPGAYLRQLRRVEWSGGELLGFNFRMPQDLGDRVVKTNSQAIIVKPLVSIITFCLVPLLLQFF